MVILEYHTFRGKFRKKVRFIARNNGGKQIMPRFQAFISDMDDTLLPAHKPMSERTQRTLQRLSRQGVSVVLCSGRAGASILPFVRQVS